ncbi:MAG: SIMPL domain-containing protein [Nitrososphaerota archaeon]
MSEIRKMRGEIPTVYALTVSVVAIAAVLVASLYAMNMLGSASNVPYTQQTGDGEGGVSGILVPVRGIGIVRLKPDRMTFMLGVEARGATPLEASNLNSAVAGRVVASLLANGVVERNIKTSYIAINPDWKCDKDGCRQEGFVAINQVTVTLEDNLISEAPKIISDAIQAGATNLQGAWFDLKDETRQNLRDSALQKAFADATAKVSKIAEYLNMRIKDIKQVQVLFPDEGGGIIPIARVEVGVATGQGAGGPPIMTGEITYTVTVDITYVFEPIS